MCNRNYVDILLVINDEDSYCSHAPMHEQLQWVPDRSQIRGKAKISGLLISCKNKFAQKLTISSDKTYLEETESGDIEISRGGDTQVLYLGNQTVVHGNITFIDKHGLVLLDKTSKIEGRVIGGYLDKNNFQLQCGDQNLE